MNKSACKSSQAFNYLVTCIVRLERSTILSLAQFGKEIKETKLQRWDKKHSVEKDGIKNTKWKLHEKRLWKLHVDNEARDSIKG